MEAGLLTVVLRVVMVQAHTASQDLHLQKVAFLSYVGGRGREEPECPVPCPPADARAASSGAPGPPLLRSARTEQVAEGLSLAWPVTRSLRGSVSKHRDRQGQSPPRAAPWAAGWSVWGSAWTLPAPGSVGSVPWELQKAQARCLGAALLYQGSRGRTVWRPEDTCPVQGARRGFVRDPSSQVCAGSRARSASEELREDRRWGRVCFPLTKRAVSGFGQKFWAGVHF